MILSGCALLLIALGAIALSERGNSAISEDIQEKSAGEQKLKTFNMIGRDDPLDQPNRYPRGWMPCTGADEGTNFAFASGGIRLEGYDVTHAIRACDSRTATNYVGFIYGWCKQTGDEGGCLPPLTVESWPACLRSLADYESSPGEPYPHGPRVRLSGGAIVVTFNQGARAEVYTGATTIVIFGEDASTVAGAVDSLMLAPQKSPIDTTVRHDGRETVGSAKLGPPVRGSLRGMLICRNKSDS
jgi:hypothetical protein